MLGPLNDYRFKTESARVLSVLILLFVVCVPSFAQDWFNGTGAELTTGAFNIRVALAKVLKYILLIGGAGAAVFAIISMMKGEQDSAARFGIWLLGMVLGFILITVLTNVSSAKLTAGGADPKDFGALKNSVRDIISILLSLVSMLTVVGRILQLVNGEKEGGRQLFKWFVVSMVGQLIVSVI